MGTNRYQTLFKKLLTAEHLCTGIVALVAMAVTCYPFRHPGLYGYLPDIIYHLNRIEGVRNALLSGSYPVAIYAHFFDGQGYGSPLFYPDFLLLIPAGFRLMGLSPLVAYKLTCTLFSLLIVLVTKNAIRYVVGRWEPALAGAMLFTLSQFLLADLVVRAGFSSYLSYVWLPILVAGIYDFFIREGRRTWLLGLSLGGLVVTHTINAFQGVVFTALLFVLMLVFPEGRAALKDRPRLLRLAGTALLTLCISAWYWLPMLEQMTSGEDFLYRHPWADISVYTQPWQEIFDLTGSFFDIAHVGLGIPILVLVLTRAFLGLPKNKQERFGDLCYFLGLILLVVMTEIFPWKLFSHTIFNELQFTFRIFPFALIFLCFGMSSAFERLFAALAAPDVRKKGFLLLVLCLTFSFGALQNSTELRDEDNYHPITEGMLYQFSYVVGRGEWLPTAYDTEAERMETVETAGLTIPARIYYKGYRAFLTTPEGERRELPVYMADNGLCAVENPENLTGTVALEYRRTLCQWIALFLSVGTILGLTAMRIAAGIRGFRGRPPRDRSQHPET